MANKIPAVEAIQKEIKMGYPNGVSEAYKMISVLMARIDELERALQPFARVALGDTFSGPEDMVNVYMKHCQGAWRQLDSKQGEQAQVVDFGIPTGR